MKKVIKVTGNISQGGRRTATITPGPGPGEFLSFGPQGFTKSDTEHALFDESINAGKALARSDGILAGIAGAIGKKVAEIGKGVIRGYSREGITAYAYARTGSPTDGDVPGGSSQIDTILDIYGARRATQPWLQEVTGKRKYVFGAAVPDGADEGIYVDDSLVRKAGKYISSFTRGVRNKAREYATDFVETLLTLGHEYGHKNEGIRNEQAAEQYAERNVIKLAETDKAVGFALSEYRRPLQLAA